MFESSQGTDSAPGTNSEYPPGELHWLQAQTDRLLSEMDKLGNQGYDFETSTAMRDMVTNIVMHDQDYSLGTTKEPNPSHFLYIGPPGSFSQAKQRKWDETDRIWVYPDGKKTIDVKEVSA